MAKTKAIKPAGIESKALVRLGDKANTAHRMAMKAGRSALKYAIECGQWLAEAKAGMKHGEWTPWVGEKSSQGHFEASQRTADIYMRLHKNRDLLANSQSSANLSVEGGLKQLAEAKKDKRDARIKKRKADRAKAAQSAPQTATIHPADGFEFDPSPVDLLLTDPPYSTDVEDINTFAPQVVSLLRFVKPTGRGYICVGAYPGELRAYLNSPVPDDLVLEQILVWTYRDTLGPAPKRLYKSNWQAILYFVGKDAPALDCPELVELFSVLDIPAHGQFGCREHPWQKPDALAERLIFHATKPGQIVYDPFAGTGTFIIQAALMSRQAVGCEIDPDTLALAVQRGCDAQQH